MTARASSEQVAREWLSRSGDLWRLRGTDYEHRVASLAALLDARERPLLEQVSALRESLEADGKALRWAINYGRVFDHLPHCERKEYQYPSGHVCTCGYDSAGEPLETRCVAIVALLASTEAAAREFVARVEAGRLRLVLDGAANLFPKYITDADTLEKVLATLSGLCAHGDLTDEQKEWARTVGRTHGEDQASRLRAPLASPMNRDEEIERLRAVLIEAQEAIDYGTRAGGAAEVLAHIATVLKGDGHAERRT